MKPRPPSAPEALSALPELAGAEFGPVLRDRPDWLVLSLRLAGRPAFLKQFRQDDAAQRVRRAAAWLNEAGHALGQQQDAVAPPLLVLPRHGIIVTRAAPGQPLARLLPHRDGAARAALLARTGHWLARLAAASRTRGSFGPRFWIRGLETRLAGTRGDWIDRDLVAAHLARMQDLAATLRGASVERAALHGDLTPDNLFLDPATGCMTGIDMQAPALIPVARDVARLLVWLESRRETAPARQLDGIALPDRQALIGVDGLLAPDQAAILRFQIGELLLAYYLDSARQPLRRRALVRGLRDWALMPGP